MAAIRNLVFSQLGEQTTRSIKNDAFNKILKMPVAWFEDPLNQPQKITAELTNSCKTIYSFVEMYLSHISIILTNILVSIIGAIVFEWRTGLTSLGLIPLIIISQGIQLAFIKDLTEGKGKIYSNSSQIINEVCLLYTSPSPRDLSTSRMPSSA